jgi:propanol-preferring alcohol dehydrogenase
MMNEKQFLHLFIVHPSAFIVSSCERVTNRGDADRGFRHHRGAHRRLARQLGAAWAGEVQDEPPAKINSGIVFAPAGWIVLEALRVLEKGGTLSLAGIYMSPIPAMDYNLLYHERTIRSAANSTREDVRELLRLAGEIPIRTEIEVFPLEAANEALQRLKRSEINGAGVLAIPQN